MREFARCPHCGKSYQMQGLQQHVARCVLRPETLAALRVALADPHLPGCIRMMDDYDRTRDPHLPGADSLRAQLGSWMQVAETCNLEGLTGRERASRMAARGAEQTVAALVERGRRLRAEQRRVPGLEYLRCYEARDGVHYVLR